MFQLPNENQVIEMAPECLNGNSAGAGRYAADHPDGADCVKKHRHRLLQRKKKITIQLETK